MQSTTMIEEGKKELQGKQEKREVFVVNLNMNVNLQQQKQQQMHYLEEKVLIIKCKAKNVCILECDVRPVQEGLFREEKNEE